jgi:flavin reductase (DIM6/NTAB) family NADH-FMN oxidoreductase RutF
LGACTGRRAAATDALASFECRIVAEHPAGDHWIVVGRVSELRIAPIDEPLVCFASGSAPRPLRDLNKNGRSQSSFRSRKNGSVIKRPA